MGFFKRKEKKKGKKSYDRCASCGSSNLSGIYIPDLNVTKWMCRACGAAMIERES